MKLDKEFKEAIVRLPSKEKDKLLLRLLKKDLVLLNQLHFELMNTKSVDDARQDIEDTIIEKVARFSDRFYSMGYLNMDIRYLSGDITYYAKVTKDKFGEAYLNL